MANLISGLGGDSNFGEEHLSSGNQYGNYDITSIFQNGLNLFGRSHDKINVDASGFTSFNSGPFGSLSAGSLVPNGIYSSDTDIITPFWAHNDHGSLNSNYQHPISEGGTSTGSGVTWFDIDSRSNTITVTWDDVTLNGINGSAESNSANSVPANAFQMRIIKVGDNGDFDLEFRYEDINWIEYINSFSSDFTAIGGFSSYDGEVYHEIYPSGADYMLQLESTYFANSDEPGVIRYQFRDGYAQGIGFDNQDDNLQGTAENDYLDGANGADDLYGYGGDDILSGSDGSDRLFGGAGDDTLIGGRGIDHIDGGTGMDSAIYHTELDNLTITEISEGIYDVTNDVYVTDRLVNVEKIITTDDEVVLSNTPFNAESDTPTEPDTSSEPVSPTIPVYEPVDYGPNDDVLNVQHPGIISSGAGNDTYVIAPGTLRPTSDITITDTLGTNNLQFIQGLTVSEVKVANNSLLLTIDNDSVITLLGATSFSYVIGGNPLISQPGTSYSFTEFVENVLGVQVPSTGIVTSTGFEVGADSVTVGTPADNDDEEPATDDSVVDTGLSDAQIHSDIENLKEFINGQFRDNFRAIAEADLQNGGDGITPISSLAPDFEANVLAYDADDMDEEFELIEEHSENFDSDYITTMLAYEQQYSAATSPLKAIYNDVMYTDLDHLIVGGNDTNEPFIIDITDDQKDLLIYSEHNDYASITGFEANQTSYSHGEISDVEPGDDLYLGDVAMHLSASYGAQSNALNWISDHASSFIDDKVDALIFQDGANAVIWIENDATNSISSATSTADFNVIELVGVNADDLTFNDGFIQLQEV